MALSEQLCAILSIPQHGQHIPACPGFEKCSRACCPLCVPPWAKGPAKPFTPVTRGNLGQQCGSGILSSSRVVPKETGKLLSFLGVSKFCFPSPRCWESLFLLVSGVEGQRVSADPTGLPFASLCLCSARRLFCIAKDVSLSPVQKGNAACRVIICCPHCLISYRVSVLLINHKAFFFLLPPSSWSCTALSI